MFFFSKFRISFHTFVLDRPKLFQMIVSDEFLKQFETEAFQTFNRCFSTEFTLLKNTYVSEKLPFPHFPIAIFLGDC